MRWSFQGAGDRVERLYRFGECQALGVKSLMAGVDECQGLGDVASNGGDHDGTGCRGTVTLGEVLAAVPWGSARVERLAGRCSRM